jgi:hypothetical protein
MIQCHYEVRASAIPGAGLGVFITEPACAGQILVCPDQIPATFSMAEITARPDADAALSATVRWFEERYTVSLDWPDECYLNHSFTPTGIWHLGFVFAAIELPSGTELTIDYRHLLAPGQVEVFKDSQTGQDIVGLSWAESFALSLGQLSALQNV